MKQIGKRTQTNPCRKCGYTGVRRTDRVDLGDYGYIIKCPRCRSKSSIGETVEDAVSRWNAENPVETDKEASA